MKKQDSALKKIPKRNIDRLYQLGKLGSEIFYNEKLSFDKKIEYIGMVLSLIYSLKENEIYESLYKTINNTSKTNENFKKIGKKILGYFVLMYINYEYGKDSGNAYNLSKTQLIFNRLGTDKIEISHIDYNKKIIVTGIKASPKSSLFSSNKAMLLNHLCGKKTDDGITKLINTEKEQWRIFKIGDKCFDLKKIIDDIETNLNNKIPQFPTNNTTNRKWTQLQLFEIKTYYEKHSYNKLIVDMFLYNPVLWVFDQNWKYKIIDKLSTYRMIWDDAVKKWKKKSSVAVQ